MNEQIRTILKQWDPIGIAGIPEADSEYDTYVDAVYRLIAGQASQNDLFCYLWRVETEMMGLPGNRSNTLLVAARLAQLQKA